MELKQRIARRKEWQAKHLDIVNELAAMQIEVINAKQSGDINKLSEAMVSVIVYTQKVNGVLSSVIADYMSITMLVDMATKKQVEERIDVQPKDAF